MIYDFVFLSYLDFLLLQDRTDGTKLYYLERIVQDMLGWEIREMSRLGSTLYLRSLRIQSVRWSEQKNNHSFFPYMTHVAAPCTVSSIK